MYVWSPRVVSPSLPRVSVRVFRASGALSASERAAFIAELTEIQTALDASTKQYERQYGESYFKMASLEGQGQGQGAAAGHGSHYPTAAHTQLLLQQQPLKGIGLGSPAAQNGRPLLKK
jgi:hypothetical protein